MGGIRVARRSLQLESQILRAYDGSLNRRQKDLLPRSSKFCRECARETIVVWDKASGDSICVECGVVLMQHERVDTPYGRGMGGYSAGSLDSLKLDLITGAKAIEGGRTRKYYKTLLKRAAESEIDGLVNDENVRETAKIMFQRYTEKLDVVRHRSRIISACIAAAESRIRRIARQGHETPEFPCKDCGMTFSSKKERRFHKCSDMMNNRTRKARKKNKRRSKQCKK